MPVPGYDNNTVNTLRLFSARSTCEFDLDYFNHGDYMRACEDKLRAENITKVLYPKDDSPHGKELRLQQEYLLVSASLQDILARFRLQNDDWELLPERAAIQLNDTHPALAIPELMRLLMDREGLEWDEAWDITIRTFAYTNHTRDARSPGEVVRLPAGEAAAQTPGDHLRDQREAPRRRYPDFTPGTWIGWPECP